MTCKCIKRDPVLLRPIKKKCECEDKLKSKSSARPRGHMKTWACVKPGGDGCDGNHGDKV